MNDPTVNSLPRPPSQSGAADSPSPSRVNWVVGRIKVSTSIARGSEPADELQALLRSRVRIFVLIGLCASGIFLAKDLLTGGAQPSGPSKADLLFQALLVVTNAAAAVVLWKSRTLSFRGLRVMELLVLGLTVLSFSWEQYAFFRTRWPTVWAEPLPEHGILLLTTNGLVLQWFGLLVAYGTLIPNTWRRCATVVGVVALAPLAVTAAAGLSHGDLPRLPDVLLEMAICMAIAAAIAIYGSYRIEELRQEASEARKLGQYELKRSLGAGGMGEVFLAQHALLRRLCALKLIRPERAGDPTVLLRFQREVQATATLTHWNTIDIFDYGHTDDGTFYYAMEYLPGWNLHELVRRFGPLPPERAVHLLRQVCQALREAHAIGLIHRDVKPNNIMTCERGRVYDVAKVLDFGLVRDLSLGSDWQKLTEDKLVTGSPEYMSPEQAKGKENLDGRCDIYGLGAVAYFLLTGQPPFVRNHPMEVLMAHVHDPVVRLTDVRADLPADLQEVVLRCLAKNPADRFPDADSLELALAGCGCAALWTQQRARQWWQMASGKEVAPAQPARA